MRQAVHNLVREPANAQESRQHLQASFPETCETDCKRIFEPFYEEYDQKAPLAPLTR